MGIAAGSDPFLPKWHLQALLQKPLHAIPGQSGAMASCTVQQANPGPFYVGIRFIVLWEG